MPIIIPFPMLQDPPILKADISRYQAMYDINGNLVSHFDFDKYKEKSKVITLRGGVAADGLDWEFQYNVTACVERNILIDNIYHYTKLWKNLDNQVSIIEEFYNIAKSLSPNHYLNRITLDIEQNDGLNKNTFTGNAEKIVSRVYNKIGIVPDIYTRAYFWNQNTYMASWMKECALWIAHHFYGLDPYSIPIVRPFIPDAWGNINNPITPIWWQFDTNDNGKDWGSTGDNEIDLNFFTFDGGTAEAFESYYGVPYPVVLPPPQPGEDWRVMVIDQMSIRNEPVNKTTSLFGKGIKNKKVKVIGTNTNGYVPVETWLLEKSLKKV